MKRRSRSERLDDLPYTRKHGKLMVGSGVGWALDAMDIGLIGFVVAALRLEWQLTDGEAGLVVSMGFVGMAVGASLGGLLADRIGRRNVFALTLLVYGLATGATALVSTLTALLVLRVVVGLGLGAELPVASTLVSEYAPKRIRGRIVVILEAWWALGWIAAACIGYFVIADNEGGWRWALAIGAIPAAYALIVRLGLPESVHFLETKGRHDEAEAAVQGFENSPPLFRSRSATATATVEPDNHKDADDAEHHASPPDQPPAGCSKETTPGTQTHDKTVSAPTSVAALFTPTYRRRTSGLWLVWFFLNFAYYGSFTWLPSLLSADGRSLTESFSYVLIITLAQLPGYAMAAWLIEAWGRRSTLATFLLGSGVAAGLFALSETPTTIILSGCLLSFFALGAWGALYAATPEQYPTAVRGTGAGWAAGFGRIASILAPMVVPLTLGVGGVPLVFATFAFAFVAAACGALLMNEARGKALSS